MELPTRKGPLPPQDAALLRSGRACIRAVLDTIKPQRLVAPYYVCDSALAAARTLGIPIEFYAIDEHFAPVLPDLGAGDALLVVNYFGLGQVTSGSLQQAGDRLLVDQTQALFAEAPTGCWSFTSVRKWFGVPDGAFLWGPSHVCSPTQSSLQPKAPTHLLERRWGEPDRAYRAYAAAEASFDTEVEAMSALSKSLLGGIDVELVRRTRRENFLELHALLGPFNKLAVHLRPTDVPFCYPFLPRGELSRTGLAKEKIFVPQFWADCLARGSDRFPWEMELCRALLPLPVDHRYGHAEMVRMAEVLLRISEEKRGTDATA